MSDFDLISAAFGNRKMPEILTESTSLSKHEHEDVEFFLEKDWRTLTVDDVQSHHEAIFWFSPNAFCYYLPGFLLAGVKDNRPDLLAYHSILNMLDRSPNSYLWDEFFLYRWPLLNKEECQAVKTWVRWLEQKNKYFQGSDKCSRALKTLDLLQQGVIATK